MAQQILGQGPGNLVPDSETKMFLANGAVAKGDVVGLVGNTGYTVDQTSTSTIGPIGVAKESGTDVWIEVVISGFCDFVTNNGTDVVAGDFLVAGAGVAIPTLSTEVVAGTVTHIFGQSLGAETSTTCTECIIYKKI